MSDAMTATIENDEEINRFHFLVGLIVLTATTLFSAFAIHFLFLS